MPNSQIIEMVEINSPSNTKQMNIRRDSKVHSPIIHSVSSRGESDISNIFLVKPSSVPKTQNRNHQTAEKICNYGSTSEIQDISDSSDDFINKHSFIESPSKIESRSYKDKIKNRFRAVKENAGKSSFKANFKTTTKRLIMESIRSENSNIDAELLSLRNNLDTKEGNRPSRVCVSNFFTDELSANQARVDDNEEVANASTNIQILKSTERLIEDDKNDVVKYEYPERLKLIVAMSEKELFYHPSRKTVNIANKICKEEVRFLEEEGLYVNKSPTVPISCINMIEARLAATENKKWFNCEGKMNILENPARTISERPNKNLDYDLTVMTNPTINHHAFEEIVIVKQNILELHIRKLKFTHHPLFSLEHVLEQQLISVCEQYERLMVNNTLKKISNRLDATRHVLANIQETSKSSGDETNEKYSNYRKEIKYLRELHFKQGKTERQLLRSSLEIWKNIKKMRIKNGFSSTKIKLIINKERTNVDNEKEFLEKRLQLAFQELIEDYKEEYSAKVKQYKKDLREWNESNKSESDGVSDSPKKPDYNINEDCIMEDLKICFRESFKTPEEPVIRFVLTNDNDVSKIVTCSQEILRRNAVQASKIHIKVICNKLEVCKLKPTHLNDDFCCNINEKISILLTNVPTFITIEIIENANLLQKRKICEVNLNLPSLAKRNSNQSPTKESFEKSEIIHYRHCAVGSGVQYKNELEKNNLHTTSDTFELNTSGYIYFNAWWEKTTQEVVDDGDVQFCDVMDDIIDKNGALHVNKLSEWVNQNKPDPQDPKNSILYEYINECNQDVSFLNRKQYFRLNPHARDLEFCNISELDDNIRLKILQLRNQNEPEFDGMLVPNRLKEIPFNILAEFRRRISAERKGIFIEDFDEEDYDMKRKYGNRCLKQIHMKIFQRCKSASNNLILEDVLDEKYLAHFEKLVKTVISNFVNWFRWHPRINHPLPEIKKNTDARSRNTPQEMSETSVKLLIKIYNGINIPERNSTVFKENRMSHENLNENHDLVKPFVEVRYNDLVDRTSTKEGSNPTWNEELFLVLESLHSDYLNPNSLNGSVWFDIFDNIGGNNSTNGNRNWLGSLEVPLSAICSGNAMEGHFKIRLPDIILGYKKHEENYINRSPTRITQQNISMHSAYLVLKLSVEPNIPKLSPSIDELPCNDLPYLRDHIIKWNEAYQDSFPNRRFSAFAIDSNGKTTCAVRYIRPLEPPQLNNEGFDVTPEQCAKFVSLIPFTNCNHFYQNVWLTTDELLRLLTGSIIDHAVALTCFLLSIKLDVWLLLGYGIPHGYTAYVLVREYLRDSNLPTFYIYDVVFGQKIKISDNYSPLQKVYCIVGEQNMWANIQRNDNISTMRFDFSRRNDWLPLFNNTISTPTNSVHNQIVYSPKHNVEEVEVQLEKKIRKKICKLRPIRRTIWNKHISNTFKNTMHLLQYNYMNDKNNFEIAKELSKMCSEYNVHGYVLNLPYTSISDILKRITAYEVHFKDDDVEFCSAVSIQGYSNFVACVCIFLASVKQKLHSVRYILFHSNNPISFRCNQCECNGLN